MTITTPLDQLSGDIWINGNFVKWQDAKIHILTHSLHYSGGVYEGERAYRGKIFKLEEHVERLQNSAENMLLKVPFNFYEIIEAHLEILKRNNIDNAYIRPLIFRGSESLNMSNKMLSSNLMIVAIPSLEKLQKDLNIHISKWRKPHPDALPPQVKSCGHYNMMIVALEEAKALGYDDAILLDWRGYITECTTTNIFFVKNNQLITPIADAFLNGITRQTIIKLAKELGFEIKEKYIELNEITNYDEFFLTGTSAEVKFVASIDINGNKKNFEENKITKLLQQEYANLVHK